MEEELTCAVCLQVYQDPVVLPCQHSFCLKCIEVVWIHAVDRDGISCPQCCRKFDTRPSLEKNFTLRNIVEKYSQSRTAAESAPVMCDNCIENPSLAVKTCLKCETAFCSLHLKPHLTKEIFKDHTVVDPVHDLIHRKCPDHKKILEFYCEEDEKCVCVSCTIIGKHKSHTLLSLDEAEAAIKEELKSKVENLLGDQKNCSIKLQDLEKSEAEIKTLTEELKGNLSKKFSDWRKQLEEDEKYTLKLIDEEELRVISQIRSCSESLAKKMEQIELIIDEAQKQLQRDCLSFIQDSKQLLARVAETQNVTDPDDPDLILDRSNITQPIMERMKKSISHPSAILEMIRKSSPVTLDPNGNLADSYFVRMLTRSGTRQRFLKTTRTRSKVSFSRVVTAKNPEPHLHAAGELPEPNQCFGAAYQLGMAEN
ncbi:E3 ubiquitin/ISG15 ligase TRIM25-like [Heptranchias perlo]|uniref:E3 ubiquitin/ISG15 ligase TRIM25-like n=1 Tax=Heptranchias perlo TaxID=212740 RepID=UPI00355A3A9E